MKTLIAMTALAATIATGATAMVDSATDVAEIQRYAPNADVSALTDTEIASLLNGIYSAEDGEKGHVVRSFFLQK
ncbi:MAG: hypothetical protein HKN18_13140 [Silicimonas sp.]|nr:hypothetical protein [Silicimonas sp.]